MAVQPVNPFVLKDVNFNVADDDFAAHVSQVEFTPTASAINWKGLTPSAVFSDVTTATWVCTLAFAQDWSATGLSTYLYNNEGKTVEVAFRPKNGVGPSFTADVIITPGAIGGTVDTVAIGTVSLGVKGRPELVPAV